MTTHLRIVAVFAFLTVAACASSPPADQPAAAGKHPIGGACAADADCSDGLFCDKDNPGGMCQKKCATSADCGAGAVCNDEKKCYHGCQTKSDCRDGYACLGKAPDTFCDVPEEPKK